MKMYAHGWKRDGNVYAVQINDVGNGDKKEIQKIFKDWHQSSVGWNIKNGEHIIIFCREFSDQKEWLCWAKKCPIKLTEVKFRGSKEELVQLSCKEKKKRDKNESSSKKKTTNKKDQNRGTKRG